MSDFCRLCSQPLRSDVELLRINSAGGKPLWVIHETDGEMCHACFQAVFIGHFVSSELMVTFNHGEKDEQGDEHE